MSRFAPFTRLDVPYRFINDIPLEATILVPKSLSNTNAKRYPVTGPLARLAANEDNG